MGSEMCIRDRPETLNFHHKNHLKVYLYVCSNHQTVLSTGRHPAHPASVPIIRSQRDTSSVVTHYDTEKIYRNAVRRLANAMPCHPTTTSTYMPSYWIRQAQHAYVSNPYIPGIEIEKQERRKKQKKQRKGIRKIINKRREEN